MQLRRGKETHALCEKGGGGVRLIGPKKGGESSDQA